MIIVQLNGGLGNQLFQYASGKALSLNLNAKLYLDLSKLNYHSRNITQRNFEISNFSISCDIYKSPNSPLNILRKINFLNKFREIKIYKENGINYDDKFNNIGDNTYIIGYFQSQKYFKNNSIEIFKDLTPIEPLSFKSDELLNSIKLSNSVSIHIRRGDYVTLKAANNFHGALPISYYQNAISLLSKKLNNPTFFIFSDDQEWCKSNLSNLNNRFIFVDHNFGKSAWEDLILMSHCNHHIIANSSFSWWGAWMADQRYGIDRTIFAPKRWFVNAEVNNFDRFPHHWTLL